MTQYANVVEDGLEYFFFKFHIAAVRKWWKLRFRFGLMTFEDFHFFFISHFSLRVYFMKMIEGWRRRVSHHVDPKPSLSLFLSLLQLNFCHEYFSHCIFTFFFIFKTNVIKGFKKSILYSQMKATNVHSVFKPVSSPLALQLESRPNKHINTLDDDDVNY